MYLKRLELEGFKSFAKKTVLNFETSVTAIVGPNGSGKSNVAEAVRWVLGEQSMKSLRGKRGEDLIFNGSPSMPRKNRSRVTLVFDNTKRQFDLDFKEAILSREVYRDGTNEYYINDSKVRLRDVIELLGGVSLGTSSHHIISQNETDRILNASPKERKRMIEDALGLRVYHWKIFESEKKLLKTRENVKEAQSVRREIGGHLRFLGKEAEKIEKKNEYRDKLIELCGKYFSAGDAFIEKEEKEIAKEKGELAKKLESVRASLEAFGMTRHDDGRVARLSELRALEREESDARGRLQSLSQNLGRIEGMMNALSRKGPATRDKKEGERIYTQRDVDFLAEEIEAFIWDAEETEDLDEIRRILTAMRAALDDFKKGEGSGAPGSRANFEGSVDDEVSQLREEQKRFKAEIQEIESRLSALLKNKQTFQERLETASALREKKEKEYFKAKEEENELTARLTALEERARNIMRDKDDNAHERSELKLLLGEGGARVVLAKEKEATAARHNKDEQKKLKSEIERYKIRLEEVGPASDTVLREYEEVKKRDEFLKGEMDDLAQSEKTLQKLITELKEKLRVEFKDGTEKINASFQIFFHGMFGGGKASLSLIHLQKSEGEEYMEGIKEDAASSALRRTRPREAGFSGEVEEGIAISVNLPKKKIRGLEMLSGGERALTSIALVFAMSQVKPPPFLILDETDAALDEANSRKYGEILERLAERTELIVITHNRETMSRAGVLYGVTMSSDGISRLLSVKLEDAVQIAKN